MDIKDLEFSAHPIGIGGYRAKHIFDNGYGVSVITGSNWYTDEGHPYEIAVITENGITYDTPITDDVIGYLTEDDANDVIRRVEELPALEEK